MIPRNHALLWPIMVLVTSLLCATAQAQNTFRPACFCGRHCSQLFSNCKSACRHPGDSGHACATGKESVDQRGFGQFAERLIHLHVSK